MTAPHTPVSDSSDSSESSDPDELLPIREVVRLTGVNPVTLRAWERRYGLIEPLRTEGGHRLYSQQDVQTIRSIMSWTERGVTVSKVGELLARSKSLDTGMPAGNPGASRDQQPAGISGPSALQQWKTAILQAVAAFDEPGLERLYDQVFANCLPVAAFVEVLLPAWQELLHQTGFGQRSQWLFYDAFLRGRVMQRLQLSQGAADRVLLAALPEQCRELELLVAGVLLSDGELNVKVLPLGQPLDELALVSQALEPAALVLFAPAPPSESTLRQLHKLALGVDCPLALAGLGAELISAELRGSAVASLGVPGPLMLQRLRLLIAGHLDT